MGLKLTVPIEIDGQEEQIKMEIFPDKSIDFTDYDFDADAIAVELGDDPSVVYEFYKGYDGFVVRGLSLFARKPEWAEELYYAIRRQGLSGFSQEGYLNFLKICLEKGWDDDDKFQPKEVLKNELSQEEYVELLQDLISDDSFRWDFFDPIEEIIEIISEEDFVDWLIEAIKKDVEGAGSKGYYHSKGGHLASILRDYIESGDVEVTEEFLDMYSVEDEYTSAVGRKYCFYIMGQEIGCWKTVVECRIYDPIGFYSDCEKWEAGTYGDEYEIADALSYVISEFDVEEMELDDPEPPDHPTPDPGGDYAVAYFLKKPSHYGIHHPEWTLVPYASKFDATEAAELSKIIIERDGMDNDFDIYIVKKKNDLDQGTENDMNKEFANKNIWGEHADEVFGKWEDIEWTKVFEVIEKMD